MTGVVIGMESLIDFQQLGYGWRVAGVSCPLRWPSTPGLLGFLCPDLAVEARIALGGNILDYPVQKPPRYFNPRCPMMLFSNQIADELNEFFKGEES